MASDEDPGRVRPAAFALLTLLFALSGATTLVYEVAWTRRLLLVVGSTAVAAAVVLSAFLGGLGLGGFLGGRLADRSRRPLRLYGGLELAAAAWALLVPFLLDAIDGPLLSALRGLAPGARTALRAAVAGVVVVPGAALLGATFPALLRHAIRTPGDTGLRTALLYGANTLGAVAGGLWAGWVGIFQVGVAGSSRVAAAVAAGVGLVAIAWGSSRATLAPALEPDASRARVPRSALAAAAACGFVALGLEAAGVRVLVFFVEGFTASFAAMLAAFLLGLGLGSLALGPLLARRFAPAPALFALLGLAGACALGTAAAVPSLETLMSQVRSWAYGGHEPATAQRLAALAGSLAMFLAPGVLLGATFPLAIRWARGGGASVGRAAGRVYLWNSVGSAAAPLVFLVALPLEGAFAAFASMGLLGLAIGLGGWLSAVARGRAPLRIAGLAVGAFLLAFGLPTAADLATPAALVRSSRVLEPGPGGGLRKLREVRADETTTASVVQTVGGDRFLYTDEFQAAATGPTYLYMRMLGHLPALLAASQENVLAIAFGTGTTAGAVAAHAGVERLEIAEVSRAVLALAPRFAAVNRNVLEDPRVVVRVEDGRHVLALHGADLDVITLEPLMPYTPAALPFYTADFYRLARSRLREGGVLCQWIPVHAMPVDVYASLLATFFEVFPDGTLWFFEQSSVLLGRRGDAVPDVETVRARLAEVATKELRHAGFEAPPTLASAYVASGPRVMEVLRAAPPGPAALQVVTDERPTPEAHPLPRAGLVTPYLRDTLHLLASFVRPEDPAPPELGFVPAEALPMLRAAGKAALDAREAEADAHFRLAMASTGGPAAGVRIQEAVLLLTQAVRGYDDAWNGTRHGDLALARRGVRAHRQLLGLRARGRMADAKRARTAGDEAGAKAHLDEALRLAQRAYSIGGADPVASERPAAATLYAEALMRLGRCRDAERLLADASTKWPGEERLRDLYVAVRNRRLGRDDLTRASPDAAAFLADFAPCADDDLGPASGPLERFARALVRGRPADMRTEAENLRVVVEDRKLSAERVADAVAATGEAISPEIDAVRAALLRALRPSDPEIVALLRGPDEAKRRAAAFEAARGGVERLGLVEAYAEAWAKSTPATRAILAQALALDPSPWAQGRLVDALGDAELPVRTAAFRALSARFPKDVDLAFDPAGDAAAREAAAAKIRAWVARPR